MVVIPETTEPTPPPVNRGGRPSRAVALARKLSKARQLATIALLKAIESPETAASVLVQAVATLERLGQLDQVAEESVAQLKDLEARIVELERTSPMDPRIN